MYGRLFLYLVALATLSLAVEKRTFRRLPSNLPLKIINPDSDDSELMKLEASSGGSRASKKQGKPDEDKVKTLAQQVADGKYGLIQKELFSKPLKRPGILSYEANPEVPNDNINNLGGLDKNEIWLAENHLLVLRGGKYPVYDKKEYPETIWQPIDDYKAPLHQVKIPKHPKVPPPFPVQFTENGPLQILGTNFSRPFNEKDQPPTYALPPPDGFPKEGPAGLPAPNSNSSHPASGEAPVPVPVNPSGEYGGGVSFPPSNLNDSWPPYLGYLPPGAVILPPPGNQTDLYDDDDPSIYYPPPYSFFYPKDNSSAVPAGPLVPGIILPPPPNFFTILEETTTPGTAVPLRKPPQRQRKPTTTIKTDKQIRPTTTPLPATMQVKGPVPEKPIKVYPVKNHYFANEIVSEKISTTTAETPTIRQPEQLYPPSTPIKHTQRKKPENVTILRPVKPPATTEQVHEVKNEIPDSYGPLAFSKDHPVTTTQVPLKYYTTSNNIQTNSKTRSPKTTLKPVQYYYYEEPETTPRKPVKPISYFDTTEGYQAPRKPAPTGRQRRPQYVYVTGKPYNTQKPRFRFIQQPVKTDSFSIHIAKLQNHIHQYYTTRRPVQRPRPKPVYQYSFQAANYHPQNEEFKPSVPEVNQHNFRPMPQQYSVDIQPSIEPPLPQDISQQTEVGPNPPKYNVEIQQAIQIIPTQTTTYQENPVYFPQPYQQTTPRPDTYYSTPRPNYRYEGLTQKPQYQQVVTPRPITQYSFEVTSNPVYQGFYTKPDEGFFDDNTREYFTVFGRKLPSGTTPLPGFESEITDTFASPNKQNAQYQEPKPVSLESDTVVNYVNPKPDRHPDAEIVQARKPNKPPNYPNVVRYTARPSQKQQDQNPEIVKAIPVEVPSNESKDGSYISYELPGDDGAHFYFLTPQLAKSRDQGAGFYYSQRNPRRIRRNENKSHKES